MEKVPTGFDAGLGDRAPNLPGSNCLQKPYNIHRNRLKTLAFYY